MVDMAGRRITVTGAPMGWGRRSSMRGLPPMCRARTNPGTRSPARI
jgi:hypothetical protein